MILCVLIYLHSYNQYMYIELQGPEIYLNLVHAFLAEPVL